MKKKKIACILTGVIATASATSAYASVKSYEVLSKTKIEHRASYDRGKLTNGFLTVKAGGKSDIYSRFCKDLKTGRYIAFGDETGKYVDYNQVLQEFLRCKAEGREFNLDKFIKQAGGFDIEAKYGKEQVEEVHASTSTTVDAGRATSPSETYKKMGIKEVGRDTIVAVMKDLSGGRYVDKERGNQEFEWAHKRKTREKGHIDRTLDDYNNAIKHHKDLTTKYSADEYKAVTDLNIYKDFPGLSIKFDGLNNDNKFAGSTATPFTTKGNVVNEANKLSGDARYLAYKDATYCSMITSNKEGLHNITWKPEMENDFIKEVNKLRTSRGMKPLEYSVDLHAMAKFSAKRSHFGFTIQHDYCPQIDWGSGYLRKWVRGSIVNYKSTNSFEQRNQYDDITSLKGDAGKLFGYDREISSLSDNTTFLVNAKQFLDVWKQGSSDDVPYNKLLPTREMLSKNRFYSVEFLKKHDNPVNINENLLNPEMKYIGVGAIWEAPLSGDDANGSTGLFVITSK